MMKKFSTYETLCKLPLGWSLWGLLFFIIFLSSCTNDVAEVNTPQHEEQYVTVRMNIPGMQSSISRAADAEIVKINALAFNESKELLEVDTIPISNNSRTFSLTVPNGTTTIHFLANLPDNYDLSGVNEEDDLRNLTSGDYGNTRYWGMTKYNGETELNNVALYRDMARIKVVPADDSYTEDQIIIAGLLNPNNTGKIVPYNNGFNFDLGTNDYYTLPDSVEQNVVYEGTYPNPIYVFEHDNPPTEEGLYVICKIAGYYYKIALLDNEGKPYDIIRNHEYTIYVSDLDVGETYYADAKTADPINPPVVDNEIEEVTLMVDPTTASLYYDSDNTQQITVTVSEGKTLNQLTITPRVDCFTITSPSGQMSANNGVYTYAPDGGVTGSVTFTIAPSDSYNFTSDLTSNIVFGGTGENMSVTTAQTAVTLSAMPTVAFSPTNDQTIYLGGDPLTVTMTIPNGGTLNTLSIKATGFTINNTYSDSYTDETDRTGYTTVQYTFTPTGTEAANRQITFTGSGTNINEVDTTINVAVVKPAITASADNTTLYYDKDNQTTTVTVNIPKGVSALNISATDFIVTQYNNNVGNYNNGVYTLNNTNSEQNVQFVFTMNNVSSDSGKASTTIEFSDNTGIATSPNPITIALTEEPENVSSLVVTPVGTNIINLDGENKSVTLKLTKPTDVNQLSISGVSAFDVSISPSANSWTSNNIFYCNNLNGITEIEFTFTYKSNYLKTAGIYDITFTNESNTEDFVSETIKATKSLENNVIWTGEASVNWDPGLYISKATFEAYVGQSIAIDVLTAESGDTQMNCMVGQTSIYQSGNLEKGVNKTLYVDIPEILNSDVVMAGAGVTILKIYIPETTP